MSEGSPAPGPWSPRASDTTSVSSTAWVPVSTGSTTAASSAARLARMRAKSSSTLWRLAPEPPPSPPRSAASGTLRACFALTSADQLPPRPQRRRPCRTRRRHRHSAAASSSSSSARSPWPSSFDTLARLLGCDTRLVLGGGEALAQLARLRHRQRPRRRAASPCRCVAPRAAHEEPAAGPRDRRGPVAQPAPLPPCAGTLPSCASKSSTASACATSVMESASAWARLECSAASRSAAARISSASASAAACFRQGPARLLRPARPPAPRPWPRPCRLRRGQSTGSWLSRCQLPACSVASSRTGSSALRSASARRSRRIASRSRAPRSSAATLARNMPDRLAVDTRRAEGKDLRAISSGLSGVTEEIETT